MGNWSSFTPICGVFTLLLTGFWAHQIWEWYGKLAIKEVPSLGVLGITLDKEFCPWKLSLTSFEADVFCWKTNHPDTWIPFWWFCKLELHSKKTCSLKIDLPKRKVVSQPPFFIFKKCIWIPFGWYLVLCKDDPISSGVIFNSLEVGTPTTSPIPRRGRRNLYRKNNPMPSGSNVPQSAQMKLLWDNPRDWESTGFWSGGNWKPLLLGGGRNPVNVFTHSPVEVG